MAIKGSLKEASLPDVLQLLALGQKTGCLSIADRSNFGYIYFDKGRICYASIVNRRNRLGDILVKHSKITQEQLDVAVHRQTKEHGKRLGEVLVAMAVITQADLERYMRVQIEESVYYLFTWTQGTFNFEADVRPERQDFLVSINPESLLLEGARRVDEWSLIEKKIPSFDLIFVAMAVITQADLERYMRVQIEESVYYLFTWTQGTFNFEADVRPERQDFLVSINPESLLLEGARRVDEWSLIEKKIPSFDLIFV